ncbi:Uncharacterised protein [Moraxella lacunata]|uniref:Uncharacterized protein n=1 Tax=Moraxella lacunata TaxID=477 RepID=A0A378T6V8_MORLA|nr:hypothetical protein [Moraxella lacunata]STZ56144.1 Uncharacterised protein [Moraxella lacunata]
MDWLKNLVKSLPLDTISEYIAELVIWWSHLVKDVPDNDLPFLAYVGASILVLLLLIFVVRIIPRPIGGMLWALAVAVLLTPGDTLTGSGQIAPAIAGVAHSVLMGNTAGAISAFLPILVVFVVLLFVGAIWQILRGVIEVNIAKAKEKARIQEQKRLLEEAEKNAQKS